VRAARIQRAAPEAVVPVAPPVPVVPDGPTVLEPVLPDVPPEAAPDVPAAPALALSEVVPAAVALPEEPDMPEPVVEPPDIAAPLEPAVPVDGEAVVLGVVLTVVDAPGDVVSAERRSQPATTAVSAIAASIVLVSLETACIKISSDF
jgi:hypothetical protein